MLMLLVPLSAAAQGPMIVERVQSGFMAAPDVTMTEFDRRALPLVGGYAGWVTDETIFFGAAGYWLATDSRDRGMGYGGFMAQWLARSNDRVGFGVRGLVGGGTATLTDTIAETIRIPAPVPFVNGRPDFAHAPAPTTRTIATPFRVHDDFFVAEPGADVRVRLAGFARLTAGVGYRLTADRRDESRLRGATASVGVQFGGGS